MFNRPGLENEALQNIAEQEWFESLPRRGRASLNRWAARSSDSKVAQVAFCRLFHHYLLDLFKEIYGK